jgi:His/Glu/Gln/Arg/opine family amino acid ABC transporter permease subunit
LEVFLTILKALPVTLEITLISMGVGLVIGILVASIRIFKIKGLNKLATFYVSFVRGTPLLLQLLLVYYAVPMIYDGFAES